MAKKYRRKIKARAKPKKRKATVRRKSRKRKVSGSTKRKPVKRRKRHAGRKVVKQVERRSVERVMTGKRRHKTRKRRSRKRRVVMAGPRPRRRSMGGNGMGNKMIIGLGLGALAVYLLTKKSTVPTTQYPTTYQLPPVTQTSNYTRNTQSQDIVNYAIAAGLAVDAITNLINSLNSSSDQEIQNVYDYVNTTGNIEYYA